MTTIVWKTEDLIRVGNPNSQVTHDSNANNARSESVVAANPLNPLLVVCASKKFRNPKTYEFTLAASYSADGGQTWTPSSELALLDGWENLSDPALAWDRTGKVVLVGLPLGPAPTLAFKGIAVYTSLNGGATWGPPAHVHVTSDASGSFGDDKPGIAVDEGSGGGLGGQHAGRIYSAWDDINPSGAASVTNLGFMRTDGPGMYRGFGNPSDVAGAHLPGIIDSFSPELCVTSSGTVFIFWLSAESGSGGAIKYVVSEDGGDTFTAPQVAVEGLTTLARFPHPFGFSQLPGGSFRLETFPTTCAVGESVFVAWTDARESVNGEPTARIYFRHFDGTAWQGSSSGQPLLVGPAVTAQGQHAFHPQLAAAAGTVACAHYEFGPKPSRGATSLIDVVLATSGVHPSSGLAHRTLVTDQPWDPAVDAPLSHGDQSVTFIGDYFGLSGTGAAFDVCWTDTRTGIQELFFQRFLVDLHILNIPDEVGQLIGGVASDGGGGVVLPGGVRPVPPMGPVREVIVAEAIRNLSTLLPRGENRSEIARIADEFVRRGTRSLEGQGKREK